MTVVDHAALDGIVREIAARHPSVGLAVGVVGPDGLAGFVGHGVSDIGRGSPVTEDTGFRVASISKTFTAIAVMQLVEQGRVALDAPAARYLRSFRLVGPRPDSTGPTVRQLLTHTAGLPELAHASGMFRPDFGESVPLGQVRPSLAEFYGGRIRLRAEPGSRFIYGNHSPATLGQIVEDVTSMPLGRYFDERLFAPLGMTATTADLARAATRLATGYEIRARRVEPIALRCPGSTPRLCSCRRPVWPRWCSPTAPGRPTSGFLELPCKSFAPRPGSRSTSLPRRRTGRTSGTTSAGGTAWTPLRPTCGCGGCWVPGWRSSCVAAAPRSGSSLPSPSSPVGSTSSRRTPTIRMRSGCGSALRSPSASSSGGTQDGRPGSISTGDDDDPGARDHVRGGRRPPLDGRGGGPLVTVLRRAFVRDVTSAGLPPGPTGPPRVVTEQDVADLPPVVRRYLGFMGVVGRPVDWSFTVGMSGRFRRTPKDAWMPMQAWQYNTSVSVARVFTMRLTFARVLPMVGHDTYLRGTGRMLGRLLGAVTVVDGSGPEFDVGELVTYLNDAVMLAPGMLPGPATRWVQVSDNVFYVTLADSGIEVTGRVFVDEAGAPVDFATTDRFAALPEGLVRAEWRTPVPGWTSVAGRPFPQPSQVTWQLPDGPFTYVDGGFIPGSITYNQPPPA